MATAVGSPIYRQSMGRAWDHSNSEATHWRPRLAGSTSIGWPNRSVLLTLKPLRDFPSRTFSDEVTHGVFAISVPIGLPGLLVLLPRQAERQHWRLSRRSQTLSLLATTLIAAGWLRH